MSSEAITLIGDVRRSRTARDRAALHARLEAALAEVDRAVPPVEALRVTVGDEYQGTFADAGDAARAALRLRLLLLPDHDVRHGIGAGPVEVLAERPRVEDGPGWWAAREALHAVELDESRPATRWRRTAFRAAAPSSRDAWLEAVLVLHDERVGALDARSVSVLRGLLRGSTQREVAEELGISASAVSQRVRGDGLAALVLTDELLEGARR